MTPHKWTKEEIDFIRETYQTYDRNVTLKLFNEHFNLSITKGQFKSAIDKHKITCGRKTRFQNGTTPYNKGKSWDEWMSKESQNNSRKTTFKKDIIPHTNIPARPIGAEKIDNHGYIMVKINSNTYCPKQRVVWEQAYGAIPEGHSVIFADGNNRNFDLDNLILVSKAELITMNSNKLYFKGNADATKCGVTLSKLMIRGNERAKK